MIAHASGFSWDEALLILGPIAVIVALLAVARKRAASGIVADGPGSPTAPSEQDHSPR